MTLIQAIRLEANTIRLRWGLVYKQQLAERMSNSSYRQEMNQTITSLYYEYRTDNLASQRLRIATMLDYRLRSMLG